MTIILVVICLAIAFGVIEKMREISERNTALDDRDIQLLREQSMREKAKNIAGMEGHDFEQYIAMLLSKNGYQNVKVTQGSGDYGIDVIAEKDGYKYAIQCKRYSSPVGNHAVQEAYSGKSFYDADLAVVITNSTFTEAAKTTANKIGVLLWDKNYLQLLIDNAKL